MRRLLFIPKTKTPCLNYCQCIALNRMQQQFVKERITTDLVPYPSSSFRGELHTFEQQYAKFIELNDKCELAEL